VEEQAAADAKHAARVRLENSSFLVVVLRSAALGGSTSDPAPAVLRRYLEAASALKQSSLALYVDQQAEYAGLARAVDLGRVSERETRVPWCVRGQAGSAFCDAALRSAAPCVDGAVLHAFRMCVPHVRAACAYCMCVLHVCCVPSPI
jgi:hypothetical protein